MTIKEIFIEELEKTHVNFDYYKPGQHIQADYIDDAFSNVLEVVEKTAERWAQQNSQQAQRT